MKHRLQTLLKHKLQWLVLLTALLGVSQEVWATWPESYYWDLEFSGASTYKAKDGSVSLGSLSNIYTSDLNLKEWHCNWTKKDGNVCGYAKMYWRLDATSGDSHSSTQSGVSWDGSNSQTYNTNISQKVGDRGSLKVGSHKIYIWYREKGDKDGSDCNDEEIHHPWSGNIEISFTIPAPSNVYITGTAKSVWGTWDAMTSQGSNKWSIGVSANSFKISHKDDYDGTWYGPYTVNSSKCVGASISKDGGDNNASISVNTGYQNPVLWVDVANQELYVVAECATPSSQTVKANDSSSTITVCTGASVTITTDAAQNGYTYKLYAGSSSTPIATRASTGTTGLDFGSVNPSSNTTYKVKAFYTGSTCSETQVGSVTVNVDANAALTKVSLSNSSICLSGTSTATATGAVLGGGTGAWSYSGSAVASVTNTDASSTVKTSTVTASSSTSGDATITYTITNGCDATAHTKTATISKSATITVKPNASVSGATITFEPGGETCNGNGTRATIDGVVLGGGTGAWSKVSGTGGSAIDATTGVITGITTGTSGSHTFRYTITGGCGSGTKTKDGSVTLGYSPILSPVIKTVKAYEPVSFTSTNANITEWSLSTESSTNYLYDTGKRSAKFKGEPGTYTIKATSTAEGLNCPGSATVIVEEDDDCIEP